MRRLICLILLCLIGRGEAAQLVVRWSAPTLNVDGSPLTDLAGFRVYYRLAAETYGVNYVQVGNTDTVTISTLASDTLYYVTVRALDSAGNEGPAGQETGNRTPPTTPTAPTFVRMVGMTCRQVRLRWNPAFDDVSVAEYRVRRGGVQIAVLPAILLVYDDVTAGPSTAYTYTVRAADAPGNESGDSNSVVLTTPTCP